MLFLSLTTQPSRKLSPAATTYMDRDRRSKSQRGGLRIHSTARRQVRRRPRAQCSSSATRTPIARSKAITARSRAIHTAARAAKVYDRASFTQKAPFSPSGSLPAALPNPGSAPSNERDGMPSPAFSGFFKVMERDVWDPVLAEEEEQSQAIQRRQEANAETEDAPKIKARRSRHHETSSSARVGKRKRTDWH